MIRDLKAYAAYKDSGVPWLGQIPEHWHVVRSKRLFTVRKERSRPEDVQLSATQAYGVIPQSEFEGKVGRRVVKILMHLDKRRHVERDDFVISMRSFQGGLERAWASGAIRSSYVVLKPEPTVDVAFFSHLLKSVGYIRALQATADFIRDGQDLTLENFNCVDLPLIPVDEQRLMARHLAALDGKVGRYIRAKQKLIKLLEEQKQAIIHRAVTRGLDPTVRLKPSGVEWLGEVPEHWEVLRLRQVLRRIDQGISPGGEARLAESGGWGVLKAGCANRGVFRETEHKRLPDGFGIDPSIVVNDGDVIVSRCCGSPALVGSVARVSALRYQLVLSDKTFRLVFREPQVSDFAVAAMNSRYWRVQVEQSISGADGLANNLPLSSLRDFRLALPSREEAERVAAAIRKDLAQTAAAMDRAHREITLLREFRTRLVTDVVTGKLDVRAAAAALPDEADSPDPLGAADPLADEDLEAEPEEVEV